MFIAFLHKRTLKLSTIRTYLSAITFKNKLHGFQEPCSQFFVQKCLQGIKKLQDTNTKSYPINIRLPITKLVLHDIIRAIPITTKNRSERILYKALFLFTYYACLRVGEAVISNNDKNTLRNNQLSMIRNQGST